MESAMIRAVHFWYPPDVTMRMGTWWPRTILNTSSSRFTTPCKWELGVQAQAGPEAHCLSMPFQQDPPTLGPHLWGDGQPPKTVALQDIGARVVHHHIRRRLLQCLLQVPFHPIQVLIVLCAPFQFHLPVDGLWGR